MNFYDVPYHIIPNDEECVINASQIGKRIGEAPSTIRTWANQYEEYLYIKKVNGRFVYTEKSVIQFEFIKKLRDKGFPHVTIEEIIRNNGFDCDIDSQTIKSGNPIELQALATGLSLENKKQFEQFMVLMMEQQEKNNKELLKAIKEEVSITTSEIMDTKIDELSKQNEYLKQKLDEIDKDNKLISELQKRLIEKKKETKKSFWKKLFKK